MQGVRSVWIGAPEAVLQSRLAVQAGFTAGASDPMRLAKHSARKSFLATDLLWEQATRFGERFVELSGLATSAGVLPSADEWRNPKTGDEGEPPDRSLVL
jgi:hypothetical protein